MSLRTKTSHPLILVITDRNGAVAAGINGFRRLPRVIIALAVLLFELEVLRGSQGAEHPSWIGGAGASSHHAHPVNSISIPLLAGADDYHNGRRRQPQQLLLPYNLPFG